ncbi:Ldh family oxidoreductase [Pelagibacterium sp. H642]|uniref:Ldh family oxidoreductase n=1 Tax=Pelagibacterium sp. H642 TaxID=1881069 RepID=UPI0028169559|nr:Ldh family oxidoreductase [Pelagibacterium sp. H642]WMT91894.1 Ldh family oxidoreductase [Pelagibacterium sp. H642]
MVALPDRKASGERFTYSELIEASVALFAAAGMQQDMAQDVGNSLVMADAIGHSTHGLAIAPWYLDEIASGSLRLEGSYEVVSDRPSCVAWNGCRLAGAWLINRAIDVALERIDREGVVTLTIGNGYHTGALATYLPRLTARGLMVILACSGPAHQGVAPFGGTRGIFTPNPLAAGIPTGADPILLDISCSITTVKRSTQLAKANGLYDHEWLLDERGVPTRDPKVLIDGQGTLMPIGGMDHGHKGYAMALLVEALTQGLSGTGRRQHLSGTVMNTFLQVIDPAAFGGKRVFTEEMDWLVDRCRENPPRPGVERVRIPGDQARHRLDLAERDGVFLPDEILKPLKSYFDQFGIAFAIAR